jgi:dienelactone hydrolase
MFRRRRRPKVSGMSEQEFGTRVSQSETAFVSGGIRCAATVYRRAGAAEGSAPVVVMTNGITLTRRDVLPVYANRFAEAGAVVLAIDCRSWGDSGGEPRGWFSVRRMRADVGAAVGFARGLPGVDPDRVVLWGFSLAGAVALQVAAGDPRIAAVVAVAPPVDGLAGMAAPAPTGLVLRMLGRGILELVTRRPVRMQVAGRPGDDAIFFEPEFLDGFLAATAGRPWRNEVSTSWLVTMAAFRPIRTVGRITAAVLYQLGDEDRCPGAGAAVKAADRTPGAELISYPSHHFAAFAPQHLGAYCDDAIEFLHRRVGDVTAKRPRQVRQA